MNTKTKLSDAIEINLADILWKMAYQWKAIILFALVVSFLISGTMALYNQQNDLKQKRLTPPSIEQLSEGLTEEELRDTYAVRKMQEVYTSYQSYLQGSYLMSVDANAMHIVQLCYALIPEDFNQRLPEKRVYESILLGDQMVEALTPLMTDVCEPQYIAELIRPENLLYTSLFEYGIQDTEQQDDGALFLSLIVPENITTDEVFPIVDSVLAANKANVEQMFGSHEVKLLYARESVNSSANLLNMQQSYVNSTSSLKTKIDAGLKTFSEGQKALYSALLENTPQVLGNADEIASDAIVESENVGVVISKKHMALGFVLGVFIYCALVLLLEVIRPRMESATILAESLGIRSFGEVHSFHEKSGLLGALITSRTLYKLRYKNRLQTEEQVSLVQDDMHRYLKKHESEYSSKDVAIVALEELTPKEQEILTQMPTNHLIAPGKSQIVDVTNLAYIIIALQDGRTGYKAMDTLIADCKDYNVQIIGCLLV